MESRRTFSLSATSGYTPVLDSDPQPPATVTQSPVRRPANPTPAPVLATPPVTPVVQPRHQGTAARPFSLSTGSRYTPVLESGAQPPATVTAAPPLGGYASSLAAAAAVYPVHLLSPPATTTTAANAVDLPSVVSLLATRLLSQENALQETMERLKRVEEWQVVVNGDKVIFSDQIKRAEALQTTVENKMGELLSGFQQDLTRTLGHADDRLSSYSKRLDKVEKTLSKFSGVFTALIVKYARMFESIQKQLARLDSCIPTGSSPMPPPPAPAAAAAVIAEAFVTTVTPASEVGSAAPLEPAAATAPEAATDSAVAPAATPAAAAAAGSAVLHAGDPVSSPPALIQAPPAGIVYEVLKSNSKDTLAEDLVLAINEMGRRVFGTDLAPSDLEQALGLIVFRPYDFSSEKFERVKGISEDADHTCFEAGKTLEEYIGVFKGTNLDIGVECNRKPFWFLFLRQFMGHKHSLCSEILEIFKVKA